MDQQTLVDTVEGRTINNICRKYKIFLELRKTDMILLCMHKFYQKIDE